MELSVFNRLGKLNELRSETRVFPIIITLIFDNKVQKIFQLFYGVNNKEPDYDFLQLLTTVK